MFVVRCSLCVVRCALFVVRCSLCVDCRFGVWLLCGVPHCLLWFSCCLLCLADYCCWLLFVVCWLFLGGCNCLLVFVVYG